MRGTLTMAATVALAAVLTGCGSAQTAISTTTVTVERTTTEATPPPAPAKKSQSRIKSTTNLVACDENVSVRAATTTCSFAQNAFYGYWESGESHSIDVYSPSSKQTLTTTCTPDRTVVRCRTDDRGLVRFSQASIKEYGPDQAKRYAVTADLGAGQDGGSANVPDEEVVPPARSTPKSSGGCHPSYSGCVPDEGYDVDCTDLSVTGIDVLGDDVYGLDRDGDGAACES